MAKQQKKTRKVKERLAQAGEARTSDLLMLSTRALVKREQKLFSMLTQQFNMGMSLEIGRIREALRIKARS
jgi:hypothetical protein